MASNDTATGRVLWIGVSEGDAGAFPVVVCTDRETAARELADISVDATLAPQEHAAALAALLADNGGLPSEWTDSEGTVTLTLSPVNETAPQ